jgi:hypothetical protein
MGRRTARDSAIAPITAKIAPAGKTKPASPIATPHGPFDVGSPATHVSSSDADHIKTTPPTKNDAATVT